MKSCDSSRRAYWDCANLTHRSCEKQCGAIPALIRQTPFVTGKCHNMSGLPTPLSCGAGHQIQGVSYAKQMIYHWSVPRGPEYLMPGIIMIIVIICTSHVGYLYPFCICFLDLVIIGGIMLESFFAGRYANSPCLIIIILHFLLCHVCVHRHLNMFEANIRLIYS